jgi:hypothetical protein
MNTMVFLNLLMSHLDQAEKYGGNVQTGIIIRRLFVEDQNLQCEAAAALIVITSCLFPERLIWQQNSQNLQANGTMRRITLSALNRCFLAQVSMFGGFVTDVTRGKPGSVRARARTRAALTAQTRKSGLDIMIWQPFTLHCPSNGILKKMAL